MGANYKARGALFFLSVAGLLVCLMKSAATADAQPFRFVILGDRTGEAVPGVYEQVWQEAAKEQPAFVITTGDIIEGLHDATAETEWRAVEGIIGRQRTFPLYPTP